MVNISTPRIDVTGAAKPERVYVQVQVGTALLSSSDRLTVQMPGERPALIEVRENAAGTFGAGNTQSL